MPLHAYSFDCFIFTPLYYADAIIFTLIFFERDAMLRYAMPFCCCHYFRFSPLPPCCQMPL